MKAEEFKTQQKPKGRRSRLAPYLGDIRKLRNDGYTLEQIREFLALNQISISIRGLTAYLQRQEKIPASPIQAAQSPVTSKPAQPTAIDVEPQMAEFQSETAAGSHDPADLDKIISSKPDLATLAKLAKRKLK